jgi:Ca2+/H+ antiporter
MSSHQSSMHQANSRSTEPWWREWPLALALVTLVCALLGKGWIATALDSSVLLIVWLVVLCGVILTAAMAIVRHADVLAHRLGEPAGTLLLSGCLCDVHRRAKAYIGS